VLGIDVGDFLLSWLPVMLIRQKLASPAVECSPEDAARRLPRQFTFHDV
jgi:hypothetical protein